MVGRRARFFFFVSLIVYYRFTDKIYDVGVFGWVVGGVVWCGGGGGGGVS